MFGLENFIFILRLTEAHKKAVTDTRDCIQAIGVIRHKSVRHGHTEFRLNVHGKFKKCGCRLDAKNAGNTE